MLQDGLLEYSKFMAAETSAQALQETWCHILRPVVLKYSISTKHFFDHTGLCYSHKIRYSIMWNVLSKALYRYT
jgi:hypothetical protein